MGGIAWGYLTERFLENNPMKTVVKSLAAGALVGGALGAVTHLGGPSSCANTLAQAVLAKMSPQTAEAMLKLPSQALQEAMHLIGGDGQGSCYWNHILQGSLSGAKLGSVICLVGGVALKILSYGF